MAYADEVLADSPWGYWRLQETAGTSLNDASPNNRDMTITGSPTLNQAGPVPVDGKAIAWTDEANQRAETAVTIGTSSCTLEAWIYVTALPVTRVPILGCANAYKGTQHEKELSVESDGRVRFYAVQGGASQNYYTDTTISLNTWHHVVASIGAAGTKIRLNKTDHNHYPGRGNSDTGARKVFIRGGGTSANVLYQYGFTDPITIAEPAFYTTQLSDARTDAHYDAAMFGPPVAVAGESFSVATAALDGEPITATGGPVAGEPFTVAATALDGTVAPFALKVRGEAFRVTTSALDGVVVGAAMTVPGQSFAVPTTALDGTPYAGAAPTPAVDATTDAVDRSNGRTRVCEWTVEVEPPVTSATRDRGLDESQAYSISGTTLVDGRPT